MSDGRGPWATELTDLVRGVSGGLLFGIPLLFTMEVWWIGTVTSARSMLAVLALTLVAVAILNRTSGFRSRRDVQWVDAVTDAFEAVAIAAVSAFVLLLVLQEIGPGTPGREILGKLAYETMPFGLGVAIAHHVLHRGRSESDTENDGGGQSSEPASKSDGLSATAADLGATVIGAVFVAFNIAPTDEVPMLSAAMGPPALAAVVAISLVATFAIVFVAGFSDQDKRMGQQGVLQRPVTETVVAYLVSLICAGVMLWFFQRVDPQAPWSGVASHVIILGLPASIGGAAGRLAV